MTRSEAQALVGQTVTLAWRGGEPITVYVDRLSSDQRYLVSWVLGGWHHVEIERAEVVEDDRGGHL